MRYGKEKYKDWILRNHSPEYKVSEERNILKLRSVFAAGEINFVSCMGYEIIEMKIVNSKNDKEVFYLHFELKEENEAHHFFREMENNFLELKDEQIEKVLLCCTGGLTTLYFATMLNEISSRFNGKRQFTSLPYGRLEECSGEYDVILLAPQIRNRLKETKEKYPGKLVSDIPVKIFARYDTFALLKMLDINKVSQKMYIES